MRKSSLADLKKKKGTGKTAGRPGARQREDQISLTEKGGKRGDSGFAYSKSSGERVGESGIAQEFGKN